MKNTKEQIVKFVKTNCIKSNCLMCKTADKYGSYTKCPFLRLKQKALNGNLTINDVQEVII